MKYSGQHRLPRQPAARAAELVRRSAPDPTAPPLELPADCLAMRRESANMRAGLYAAIEDSSDELLSLAEAIDDAGVVVDLVDDNDSLVVALDSVNAG